MIQKRDLNPAEWDEFRCGLITSMVSELSETAHRACVDISVNLHIVPWRSADFGNAIIKVASQDVAKMKEYTDFISPMCYSQMVDRDSKWISGPIILTGQWITENSGIVSGKP